ncbi:unnamed protein product [Allacma fusca]|uniref:Alpha-methylacyl-CoA racemase n=1 Tax=Allacma fusca TaxID=39272 RepID=A0A8J2JUL1_9HEXA|nr:unnamed protein product [Allacma fusca]
MALKGLRVIEIAGLAPVPFCGMLFADFGATVIRVDKTRNLLTTDKLGRGKQSIAVNMKHPEGRLIVQKLASKADVLLDPFRPGVLEKLKLGPADLMTDNPRLIYGRISGFGQTGPISLDAGHDINYLSLSGVLSRFGKKDEPPFPVNLIADFAGGGLACAFGILMALFERQTSGKGQVVDSSMTEGAAYVGSFFFKTRELPFFNNPTGENLLDGGSHFYNTYKTKDGKYMAVGAIERQFYEKFIQGMGLEGTEVHENQFSDWVQHKETVGNRFLTKTQKEWTEIFEGTDACVTPILELDEAPYHHQNANRQSFSQNPYTEYWEPEPAPKLSRTPGKANLSRPDPEIGENTVEILSAIGYNGAAIKDLIEKEIVEATALRKILI